MAKSRGSNINLVKVHNVSAILLSLLQNGTLSRVELAESLSLSNTTITNLTAELLEQKIIKEDRSSSSRKRKRVGRPRRLLRLVPSARYAVGVHIGVGVFRVALANLHAEIICNQMAEFDLASSAEETLGRIADLILLTIDQSGVDPERVIGVGVGASGLVDFTTGVNLLAPRLGWENLSIKDLLEARINLPVCVDNNVRSMALGEAFFGKGRAVGVLAFVYGRIGVGAGFVVDQKLFRGSGAGAGEIGHTIMIPDGGELCSCGNKGCLETLISEPVLLEQAELIAARNPSGRLAQYMTQQNVETSIEHVFSAARDGDQATREMIEARACYLGIALANLVNMINPELILLGGAFAQGHDLIIPMVERQVKDLAFARLGEKVQIQPTKFGWRAGVIGAASLALISFFYQHAEGI